MYQDLDNNFFKYKIPKKLEGQKVKFSLYNEKDDYFVLTSVLTSLKNNVSINFRVLESHFQYKYKIQVLNEKKWVNYSQYKYIKVDFKDDNNIRYRLFLNNNSKHLMVGFQGNGTRPSYNYTGSLSSLDVNRLYILDYYSEETPNNGAYYLGKKRNLEYMNNVHLLIEKIKGNLDITNENVILIGTSKGGFAAILYALKFGYRHCVVGSPTIYLGNSLIKESTSSRVYADFIAGGRTSDDIQWLNALIKTEISKAKACKINILIGDKERRYRNHVIPFLEDLNINEKIDVDLEVRDFEQHSLIGRIFPDYALKKISSII